MADTAPLTNAHTHARKAAEELSKTHRKESSNEHQQAAIDFSRAARTTSDGEALRVLKLLEDQHQRLARILQRDDAIPPGTNEDASDAVPGSSAKSVHPASVTKAVSSNSASSSKAKSPSVKTASRIGSQVRESSPSLARDIASRRGIPPAGRGPPSAAAQARASQLSPESKRSRPPEKAGAPPKIPASIVESQANLREVRRAKKAKDDEGFAKFYNSLTTGTMSKLSSALAYAGLPLTADDIKPEQTSQKRTVHATNEPDVKKYISKAALDAVEYQHRQRGTFGHGFGPAESFYVVQTGGGTYSYADIAKNRQAHLSGIDEDDDDSFVDAREIPGPASPKRSRTSASRRETFGKGRTHEELDLENTTLKSTIDYLSSRLSHFEAHAQDAAMASMTQSMIAVNTRSPPDNEDPAMQARLRQLEEQVEKQAEERQAMEDRASEQQKKIKRYESKWQKIHDSARAKEQAKREKLEQGGGGDDASIGVPDVS